MFAGRALRENQSSFQATALNEEAVAAAWERQLLAGELRLSSGESLQVVYRGRRNADAGPDFQDAIIAFGDGRLLHGDVEIHVRASDWRSHRHGRDPRYNGVVLHAVMWDDDGRPTLLANGATAPVLAMHPYLRVSVDALREMARQKPMWDEPCSGILARMGHEAVQRLLDRAGQARLARKAAGYEAAIVEKGPEQALYDGMMEALGYAKNREPFRQLAEYMPIAHLQGFLQGKPPTDAAHRAEAILLGVAGLLPSQRRRSSLVDYAPASLPALEEYWKEHGGERWMGEDDWHFFRTRPENFPTRRIAGAAQLVVRSLAEGLAGYFLRPLFGPDPRAVRRALVAALLVGGNRSFLHPGLIGRGRATVMVVNVILPFAVAFGNLDSQPDVADRARWAYSTFPRLPSDTIVRQVSRQLFGVPASAVVDSASRQQSLHYLYQEFCRWRRCGDCLVAGK